MGVKSGEFYRLEELIRFQIVVLEHGAPLDDLVLGDVLAKSGEPVMAFKIRFIFAVSTILLLVLVRR